MHSEQHSYEMEVSIANVPTKPRSLFAMSRNKNTHFIITPESAKIYKFVIVSASFAILVSGLDSFCNTYFCFQGTILELSFAKIS